MIEQSLNQVADALRTHADALRTLAAVLSVRPAANAERFSEDHAEAVDRSKEAVTAEAEAMQAEPELRLTPKAERTQPVKAAKVKPGEDSMDPPFEPQVFATKTEPKAESGKAESGSASVAERASPAKLKTLEDARALGVRILKAEGADVLRGLLKDAGVEKITKLAGEQLTAFCANAEKVLGVKEA